MTTNPNRVPAGVPTGGQFAAGSKSEADGSITPPSADLNAALDSLTFDRFGPNDEYIDPYTVYSWDLERRTAGAGIIMVPAGHTGSGELGNEEPFNAVRVYPPGYDDNDTFEVGHEASLDMVSIVGEAYLGLDRDELNDETSEAFDEADLTAQDYLDDIGDFMREKYGVEIPADESPMTTLTFEHRVKAAPGETVAEHVDAARERFAPMMKDLYDGTLSTELAAYLKAKETGAETVRDFTDAQGHKMRERTTAPSGKYVFATQVASGEQVARLGPIVKVYEKRDDGTLVGTPGSWYAKSVAQTGGYRDPSRRASLHGDWALDGPDTQALDNYVSHRIVEWEGAKDEMTRRTDPDLLDAARRAEQADTAVSSFVPDVLYGAQTAAGPGEKVEARHVQQYLDSLPAGEQPRNRWRRDAAQEAAKKIMTELEKIEESS